MDVRIAVTKRMRFSASHFLPDHPSPCRNLHGHNFYLEVTVYGPLTAQGMPDQGMTYEFGRIKAAWEIIEPRVDHQHLNDLSALKELGDWPPTTEVMALWFLREFTRLGVPVAKVKLSETEDNWAEVEAVDVFQQGHVQHGEILRDGLYRSPEQPVD